MKPKKMIIVGGGTSGWMAAAALSHSDTFKQWNITVVESKNIGTIGVGEGSTPYLRRFMAKLGFDEKRWMQQCDATYKTGIKFTHWNGDGKDYFHPFYTSLDVDTAEVFFNAANGRRRGNGENITGDNFFMSGYLAKLNLSPAPVVKLPVTSEYGYHFDAAKLSILLKEFSCGKGVEHIVADVIHVEQNAQGDVVTLSINQESDKHSILHGDFFIDASGFKALLIDDVLKVPFVSFADELLNDSAIAISTPAQEQNEQNYTQSKALSSGWMWKIPLQSRTGNGYVYSSRHLSKHQAEVELAKQLDINVIDNEFRHLNMKIGMRETPLKNNVLAVGLSHAFIEPLEATALMVTQCTIERFVALMENNQQIIEESRTKFNGELCRLLLGIKDYIVAHYVTSKREDSPYWQEISKLKSNSVNLNKLINSWKTGQDFDAALFEVEKDLAYFRPSWYVLFAGMDYRDEELSINHDRVTDALLEQAQQHSLQRTQHYYEKTEFQE